MVKFIEKSLFDGKSMIFIITKKEKEIPIVSSKLVLLKMNFPFFKIAKSFNSSCQIF